MTSRTLILCGALVCGAALHAPPADASVREDAGRIVRLWKSAGAQVATGPVRFVNDDETISISIPQVEGGDCLNVALVGARGLSFHAKAPGADEHDEEGGRVASVAGALSFGRCGGPPIRRIVVTSDAGRGAIETIVARSTGPIPGLRTILPERTGGQQVSGTEPGELPPLPPPDKRADIAEARARRDGARVLPRAQWRAGVDGAGTGKLTFEAGCHHVELFANDPRTGKPNRRGKLDLDAELRDDGDERLLGRDRSDAPDAHLFACVGESSGVSISYAGSPGDGPVHVTHAHWPLPEHLPGLWGVEPRARMAQVIHARHVASPRDAPVFLAQGGAGITPVPVAIEPGACYLAIVAVTHGAARGVGLRAMVGARDANDDRGSSDNAGAVAFCAEDRKRALLEVDARGTAVAWGLAVYRSRSAIWEVTR